ncbi:glycosyl transferase group 1 [Exiguobacterium sibiricum 255-15]|uniref:Glycosyl transferase group 1 n=1 Tax=Exiguobacterium sibiricum (strain DSM 17290 / CCUG 55495 / CIP 109462 / JCM 13490 / 255-15) TaxID=262543 RepID=B1YML7_EXIS2|nr:glycosyltransferase family 1 protein [Exiguobacterium sibiricum]ACB62077.1 glycosyl transferase group 1 [Exiguobacterium sibiricum 255-15]
MNNKVRVLHVLGSTNLGGAQSFVMNLYRKIDTTKIQFDFVIHTNDACFYDQEILSRGGKIFRCPNYKGNNHFEYLSWWKKFLRDNSENYEFLHSHIRSTAWIYMMLCRKYKLNTIAHSHSISSGKGFKSFVKNSMQLPIRYISNYQFACSEKAGTWLFGRSIIYKKTFKIVKNSIELEKYYFDYSKRTLLKEEMDLKGKKIIGHIGRMTTAKNHLKILGVFQEFKKNNSNTILLLIGDGELKEKIVEEANKMNILNDIYFLGAVHNVEDYLQVMDVFLFPSLWEGLGISLIEAQAAGLECVISDSIPEDVILSDLITIVPLKESHSYWAKIIQNKITNTSHRQSDINNIAEQGYDINQLVSWFEEFYRQKRSSVH